MKEKESSTDHMKIKILKNGPYIVTGNVPLYEQVIITDNEGHTKDLVDEKEFPLQENYSLCRCGESKNKPFCDGTHTDINFDGKETASQKLYIEKAEVFEGEELRLTDAHEFCDHSRFCLRSGGIRSLIKSKKPADQEMAIQEAMICPSGRLVLWNKETGKYYEHDFDPSIVLIHDKQKKCQGPIWVRGGIPIESSDGEIYEIRNRVTLCRCGKSENKPYCDGSHWMDAKQKLKFRKKWGLDKKK
ncbi:CDGSH iron-sulfur domain-containing protein [Methanobacterium alcaliphilum]|uniref:CDGSH iron-sulfur domain-containing protein n=1 Tax=Methanobacterium alcaliphilum TaxID=392018 RepID=UPI00200B8587|nr:CDGSH iron-sulfur domain-containing protein [Methanobacterium alcaliphilum]MCK9151610.1 CDGSH iron-sulfur domain-containing protein [Methanobacterium alcaliphilum]